MGTIIPQCESDASALRTLQWKQATSRNYAYDLKAVTVEQIRQLRVENPKLDKDRLATHPTCLRASDSRRATLRVLSNKDTMPCLANGLECHISDDSGTSVTISSPDHVGC